jgi:hypothetical protein
MFPVAGSVLRGVEERVDFVLIKNLFHYFPRTRSGVGSF